MKVTAGRSKTSDNVNVSSTWPRLFCSIRTRRLFRFRQPAVHPPSIERFAPVIWLAASEDRYAASEAT